MLSACQPHRLLGDWVAPASAAAQRPVTNRPAYSTAPDHFVSGWVPYWSGASGRTAIESSPRSIGDVSPLWYGTTNDGSLTLLGSASNLQAVVAATRAAGLPLIPGIFDSTGAGVMSGILGDPVTRAAHVKNIVDLVMAKGYDGIDIDYEVFAFDHPGEPWPAITPKWVAFVNELSAGLHAKGKLLSITVPPVWNNGLSGYTVYAQDQIAPVIDRLRLMVYDWSISAPGPISPMTWVTSVIAYSSSVVPVSKLQLGVPAYGRHWVTKKNSNETCPDAAIYRESVLMKNIGALAAGRTVTRHSSGELTFSWTQSVTGPRSKPVAPPVVPPAPFPVTAVNGPAGGGSLQPALRLTPPSSQVTCTVQHTVFVPDAFSVDQRSDTAQAAGWRGIILWAFGYESPNLFPLLAG